MLRNRKIEPASIAGHNEVATYLSHFPPTGTLKGLHPSLPEILLSLAINAAPDTFS